MREEMSGLSGLCLLSCHCLAVAGFLPPKPQLLLDGFFTSSALSPSEQFLPGTFKPRLVTAFYSS